MELYTDGKRLEDLVKQVFGTKAKRKNKGMPDFKQPKREVTVTRSDTQVSKQVLGLYLTSQKRSAEQTRNRHRLYGVEEVPPEVYLGAERL